MSYNSYGSDGGMWAGLFVILIWIAGGIGWILNIVKLAQHINDPVTGMFVARCVGVVAAPLGAVLGFIK
jgi:hypothetical protein